MTEIKKGNFIQRNKKIRVDEEGFVSLNDIHRAAGFSKNSRPIDWQRLPTTQRLIIATHERIVGKSHHSKFRTSDVYRAASGKNGGTWAHPILALSYAGYLKPELEVEIKEVWLRYTSNDVTLADEVLQKANADKNEWAAVRSFGRVKRMEFVTSLDDHGVSGMGYANCTNAVCRAQFNGTAAKIKQQKGLAKSDNLRDAMPKDDLVFVMAAETLAKQRIDEEDPEGNGPCYQATKKSATRIRDAIDDDKRDREPKLL